MTGTPLKDELKRIEIALAVTGISVLAVRASPHDKMSDLNLSKQGRRKGPFHLYLRAARRVPSQSSLWNFAASSCSQQQRSTEGFSAEGEILLTDCSGRRMCADVVLLQQAGHLFGGFARRAQRLTL